MGEQEIEEITSNKELMVAESRVRCIVDNAKCVLKASFNNFGAFAIFNKHFPKSNIFHDVDCEGIRIVR